MSYLSRLKALESKKEATPEPTKATEGACVGFVGAIPGHSQNIPVPDALSMERKSRALAFLEAHSNIKRACFADVRSDPANIVLTVAVRDPWGAVEVLVSRDRFDALALFDLALQHGVSLDVPEH